jgi:signal transduction histidine kinase
MAQDAREPPSQAAAPTQRTHGELRPPPPARPDATPRVAPGTPQSSRPRAWTEIWQWLRANTFVPQWLPTRWRHPATGYILVLLLQVLAAIINRLLIGYFSLYSFPGVVELLIVALIALSFGAGPSLFATLLGVALEEIVVLPLRVGEAQFSAGDVFEIVLFMIVGISISLVASATERSRQRAIQERTKAQAGELDAMRLAQENMDEFLATASHDLRTPVTALVGFIQIATYQCQRLAAAARGDKPDLVRQIDVVQGCVRDADQSAARLSRLVNLLFDTSLARVGTLQLHYTACNLAALVRDQVDMVHVLAPERAIRLHIMAKEPVWVEADPDRIGQVATNYLTNALKYSPTDQPVDVRLTVASPWARVAVEDRGPGLPPSELERIWEPFHRAADIPAQGAASATSSGLGMGLYIAKTIIEQHGGRVGVESVVNHGATFWFTLPMAEHAA